MIYIILRCIIIFFVYNDSSLIAWIKILKHDRALREAKRNSFRRLVSKVNHETPLRKVFNIAKKLRGTQVDTIKHTLGAYGKMAEPEKEVAISFIQLIQWYLDNRKLPRHMAIVIPLLKPGKDHTDPSNYRPIALTSCLCKLMEKLVNKRLMWFLENDKL